MDNMYKSLLFLNIIGLKTNNTSFGKNRSLSPHHKNIFMVNMFSTEGNYL